MVKIKPMSYQEKYQNVIDYIHKHEPLATTFIKKHLDELAVADFQKNYQAGIKPILEEAKFEQKYEAAYTNFF